MDGFSASQWTDEEFVARYLRIADIQIMERQTVKALLGSFYDRFLRGKGCVEALDLGCGCGPYAQVLLERDPEMRVTCLDASEDMLTAARGLLADYEKVRFVRTTFEKMVESGPEEQYDLIVSSLAIHHLPRDGKAMLNSWVLKALRPGGWFINIDTMLPPAGLEEWYIQLWKEWAERQAASQGVEINVDEIIYGHHQVPAHHALLDAMPVQLRMLEQAGFKDVDCIHKHGIFAMLCGQRPL
ncbi:MAG: class I SAM-dependent methyltransferase [Methanomassiliicoccales archaeon]